MATAKKSAKKAAKKTAGTLSTEKRNSLPTSTYAFPKDRKEPLNNASHVRNAIARFNQVKGVSDSEREAALGHIKSAAKRYGVEMTETSWHDLGKKPAAKKSAKKTAKKTAKKAGKKTAKKAAGK